MANVETLKRLRDEAQQARNWPKFDAATRLIVEAENDREVASEKSN
jgi:hypothetical protein